MRTVSIRELQSNIRRFVREAAEGGIIVIKKGGEPVAELGPVSSSRRMAAPDKARIFASMQEVWDRMQRFSDSGRIVAGDRSR